MIAVDVMWGTSAKKGLEESKDNAKSKGNSKEASPSPSPSPSPTKDDGCRAPAEDGRPAQPNRFRIVVATGAAEAAA
jgi:hypothetical protein